MEDEVKHTKKIVIVFTALTALALTTAGSCDTHESSPEPTSSNIINGTKTQVIRMPDGFRNVAFTCYGPQGVYVTSRGDVNAATPQPSAVFVVPNDPHCVG